MLKNVLNYQFFTIKNNTPQKQGLNEKGLKMEKKIEALVYNNKHFIFGDYYFSSNGYQIFIELMDKNLDTIKAWSYKKIWNCNSINYVTNFIRGIK